MGSLQLDCPLCCSETFPCHNSLKYHLLSISDNLICPACGARFEKIFDLAMHLGRQCADSDSEQEAIKVDLHTTNYVNVNKYNNEQKEKSPNFVQIHIKEELLEVSVNEAELNSMATSSILAKALMKNTLLEKPGGNEITENSSLEAASKSINEDHNSQEDVYYCSSCAISFTSIDDHLQEFHEGHEVFVEEEEAESTAMSPGDSSLEVIGGEHEDDEDEYDNESAEIIKAIDASELLNTVQEEECVDKDGRLYTRKVVKIEKFWDDKETTTKNPTEENLPVLIKDDVSHETIMLANIPVSSNFGNGEDLVEFYQCSKCCKKFPSMEHFSKHNCALLDNSYKYNTCKICKASFVTSEYLSAHLKSHKPKPTIVPPDPNPPFVCDICNTEFSTYKSLRLHRRMHEPIKTKDIEPPVTYGILGEETGTEDVPHEMFICQICNKPYNKEYEEAHKKFHSKEVDFNCDICNRKFYTEKNLDMHMRAHSDTKKFICSYCKKGFLTSEKLEAHMLSKCQKRQYECQYCGRRFARPHEKVKHERIHTGEKPHVCEICGKAFRVSYCLTLHMRTHSGTRPYKCDHCGKRFKAHSVYNHHLLTHSEDRKYKCPFCPKTFKTGVQLAGHKNSHTKPFTCTECNRPFASLYAVRAHMETHQRQNNLKYKCLACGATYARAFALRDHVREQHVGEHDASTDTIILETDDYSMTENVEPNAHILTDTDESMLIDIGGEAVDNMEIPDVHV